MEKDDDLDLDVAKDAGSEKKKSGAMKIVVIAVVVLLLVAGVAVGTAMMVTSMIGSQQPAAAAPENDKAKAAAAEANATQEEDTKGPITYINVEPAFVVNFEDQTLVRYLQVAVVLTTRDSKAVAEVEHHMPLIQSQLLLLFSSQQVDTLKSRRGKERLQQDALEVVRELLTAQAGKPMIENVLFTSFVMQ